MKVYFNVPFNYRETAIVMMENRWLPVKAFMARFNNMAITQDASLTEFYISVDKLIQDAGYQDMSGNYISTGTLQTLENELVETFKGIQPSSVAKFNRGVTYLIPADQKAPLPLIPNIISYPISGTTDVYVSTHYLYNCPSDRDLLNATIINGVYTLEDNGANIAQVAYLKEIKRTSQIVNFGAAIGLPAAQDVVETAKGY